MVIFKRLFLFFFSLVFDKKEEYDISSPFFNLKKVVVVLAIVVMMTYSSIVTYAAIRIGYRYSNLERAYNAKNQVKPSSNSQKPPILEKGTPP